MNSSDNMYNLLLQEIMPNYFVVDEDFEVIYNNVEIRGFFSITKGSPTLNLLNMVSPEVSLLMREAVNQVLKESVPLKIEAIEIGTLPVNESAVNLIFRPVVNKKLDKRVVIIEVKRNQDEPAVIWKLDYSKDNLVKSLQTELEKTQSNLKEAEAKLAASYEELQATNEELQSSNEELQSSNEELQSLNEELYSVNSELQERMRELSQLNEESNLLIEGADLGMVVLDRNSYVLKYTETARTLFDLKDEYRSKNILSLEKKFDLPDFPQFIEDGFNTSSIHEKEIKTYDGNHFTIRRIPLNNRLILLFLDINRVKDINQLYKTIFESSNDFVSVFDREHKIKFVNKYASKSWHHENATGASILEYIPENHQKKEVETHLKKMFIEGNPYQYYLKTHDPKGKKFVFRCKTHLIKQTTEPMGVLVSRDVTLEKQRELILRHLAQDLADIVLAIDEHGRVITLTSKSEIAFKALPDAFISLDHYITFYRDDRQTKLPENENPLFQALEGKQSHKQQINLADNRTGEIFNLIGDFYPLQEEGLLDGAIAYLHKQ